jgi:drug/metabolite transporter (DMT)-like permease
MQSLLGTGLFIPFVLVFEGIPAVEIRPVVIGHILFLAVFPSTVAFLFLSDAIRKIGASRSHVFVNMVPLVAALLSWAILGDRLGPVKIAGMVIVIGGVFLAQSRRVVLKRDPR